MRQTASVDLPGTLQIASDVPRAFASLVVARAPRSIALAGSDLAHTAYAELRHAAFDWGATDVFFGDERFVPTDSPDSNEGAARRILLDHVRPAAIHGMYRAGSIADAADVYDALVCDAPPIDLVHLGVGADAHTASLFPGTAALEERRRLVVVNADTVHPHARLTFTFPAIERSRLVVVTVAGDEKREAIARIRSGEDVPAASIRGQEVIWLCDPQALGM